MLHAGRRGHWVACCGLPFAVAATCRWAKYQLVEDDTSGEPLAWLAVRPDPVFAPGFDDPSFRRSPWVQLRWAVSVADRETLFDAVRQAEAVRDRARIAIRCGLSFAFPYQQEWAMQDAADALDDLPADPHDPIPEHVLALLADELALTRIRALRERNKEEEDNAA